MSEPVRDHLFLSFAPADWALAEWLALRLTQEGYRVWCRRFPVLGDERYPRDAADAITTGAFCVLALVSCASGSDPSTLAERTLALDLGRARGRELLVPLLVDATDGPADAAPAAPPPISFAERWERGLGGLLTRLRSLGAPRTLPDGERVATEARRFMASRRSWHTVL